MLVPSRTRLLAARDARAGLTHAPLPPARPPKPPHSYGLRIAATVATCGIYSYWWLADLMREGNDHFEADAAWEDALVGAVSD
ncbi:MAG TPA: hypothetical protein VFV35_01375 [Acidimicrobiales bacterium]|nr:hypothetical protein [Acidimicrobiales bacterium]